MTQLSLSRLGPQDSQQLLEGVWPSAPLSSSLMQQILTKAQGNPLFLEELAQSVREQEGDVNSLSVPDTVRAVLAARIDRLPAEAKRLLQQASVIGMQSPAALLASLAQQPEDLLRHNVTPLQSAEFLYETSVEGEAAYTFKHALTQEVAYELLLTQTRQELHQRIAQELLTGFPVLVEAQPELLAHHYTAAGLHEQALRYWQLAGQVAIQCSANVEAIRHLTQGLDILRALTANSERAQAGGITQCP